MKKSLILCSALMIALAGCSGKNSKEEKTLSGEWTLATADGVNLESSVSFNGKKFTYTNPVQVVYEGDFNEKGKNLDIEIPTINAETYHGAINTDNEEVKALVVELENNLIGELSGEHSYRIIDSKKKYLYLENYSERDEKNLYAHIAEAMSHAFYTAWANSGVSPEKSGKCIIVSSDSSMNRNISSKTSMDNFYANFSDGYIKWARGYFNNTENFDYELDNLCYLICADENLNVQFAAYAKDKDSGIISFTGSIYDKDDDTYYTGEYFFKKRNINSLADLDSYYAELIG